MLNKSRVAMISMNFEESVKKKKTPNLKQIKLSCGAKATLKCIQPCKVCMSNELMLDFQYLIKLSCELFTFV